MRMKSVLLCMLILMFYLNFFLLPSQKNKSMSLSTTIIRASPTPPMEPMDGTESVRQGRNVDTVSFPKSPLPPHHSEGPDSKMTSQLGQREYDPGKSQSEPVPRLYTQGDSGYSSNLNIQHHPGRGMEQNTQKGPNVSGTGSEAFCGPRYGVPSSSLYNLEDLRYGLASNYNSQGTLSEMTTRMPTLLTGQSLFNTQLAQQYLNAERTLHPSSYHLGAGPYGVSPVITGANPQIGPAYVPGPTNMSSGYVNPGQHQYPLSNTYGQPWSARDLADLRGKWFHYVFM